MIVEKTSWTVDFHRYDVDIIITNGNKQIVFNSPFIGNLAICQQTDFDPVNGEMTYVITYGNAHAEGAALDNDGIIARVKEYLKKRVAGDYKLKTREAYDLSYGRKILTFTINK